jgi:hypothetical protein
MSQGPEHAGLSDSWLADERDALASIGGVDQLVDQSLLAGRQPEIGVVDLLAEGVGRQAEEGQGLGAHWSPSAGR